MASTPTPTLPLSAPNTPSKVWPIPKDPVVVEATTTLREWHEIWKSLYLDNQIELFDKIGTLILELIDSRAELLELLKLYGPKCQQTTLEQQVAELKRDIVNKLDLGNRLLNLDLVTRDTNYKPVNPIELSPIKLYHLHADAASQIPSISPDDLQGCQESIASACESTLSYSSQASSDSNPTKSNSHSSYHLQLALRGHQLASLPSDESVEVFFTVVEAKSCANTSSPTITPLTERFLVQIKNGELICGVPNTVFTDIGSPIGRDICLYIQVYRVGKMTLLDSNKIAFGKQQNYLAQNGQDGSTTSIASALRYGPNGLSTAAARNRNSLQLFNSSSNYRRPFGATVVSIKDYRGTSFKEIHINLKVNATSESEFSQLNELYAKRGQSIKPGQNQPSIQLDLNMKFISCSQESLPKLSIDDKYCITEKRGFPDIIMPGNFKNDLFLTLETAEFEKGGKSIPKNIEASISLINKLGIAIDSCISPGSNCDNVSSYRSCVFYHSNSPKWNESVKINVPLSEFDSAHIRVEFRHCSTKEKEKRFLGFCFLPLSDQDGAVIADKSHELYLYKCDPAMWDDESLNLCKYTSLPCGPSATSSLQQSTRSSNAAQNFSHSNREIITVSTFLLSTKLTQNSNLLNLLKWRELINRNNRDFEDALRKVLELEGEEIVKFLQDILDTLFDTFLLHSNGEAYSALIFKVLVHIFLLLEKPEYQHFRPVLDNYASTHFSATLVYQGLLACVKKCIDYLPDVERHAPIQRCFRAIKYVFQFIVQSKILYSQVQATGETNDEPFLKDLRHLFKLFETKLLRNHTSKVLIPIQVTFLESFPGALTQLTKVVDPLELTEVIKDLLFSVGFIDPPPPLARAKLIFMKETASSELTKNQDIRIMITEIFCSHLECLLKYLLKKPKDLDYQQYMLLSDLCYEVLEILIVKIHDCHWPLIHRLYELTLKTSGPLAALAGPQRSLPVATVAEINMFASIMTGGITVNLDLAIISVSKELEPLTNLLDPLLFLLDQLTKDHSDRLLLQKYCTGLLTILKLMSRASFGQFMERRKMEFSKLCELFRSLSAVYNRDWSVMQLMSHAILENPISEISKEIKPREDLLPKNRQLSFYIKLIVDFITHPTLQLEVFSERKKEHILSVFGDLRLKFCAQLLEIWDSLKTHSTDICDLIPTSIRPLLDASMLPNNELQTRLIPIFWDMIDAEMSHHKFGSRQFERCFIDNLDLFINLDQIFIENFETIMKKLIDERKPDWAQIGIEVTESLTKLMYLLIDYRHSLGSSENRSKQMTCLVDLLNFYKAQDRTDLHLRYLFKLSDMHLEAGNYTEAAFTLKLYTDEIRWCYRGLVPLDGYRPEEQEWHRKEVLYLKMIHYFDLGKCWEEAITLCKELASFYETFLVDYEKLSSTLKKLAQFLDCIMEKHRPKREYFRVEFLGKDLPAFVKGKQFIYRGGECERLAEFMQRMSFEFPDVEILNAKSKQSITENSPGQFMIISNVKPVPFLDHLKTGQRNVNDKVMHYYLNNRVDSFSYDVPVIKASTQNNNNNQTATLKPTGPTSNEHVKNLWVRRYLLKTKKQLPDILPWTEVVSQEDEEVSPINHAIETISAMNLELTRLILGYKNEPTSQINPLTMRLQGVIDAAVNGGVSVYVNAFLKGQPSEHTVTDRPANHEAESVNKLKELIKQQFSALDMGLTLHKKLAPPDMEPLHNRLVEEFEKSKKTLLCETPNHYVEHHNQDQKFMSSPTNGRRETMIYYPSMIRYSLKSNQKAID